MKDKKVMSTRWLKSVGTLAFALALSLPGVAGAQKAFDTPQAAVDALVDSLARQDNAQLRNILGPDYRQLISLDELSSEDRYDFLAAWAKGHRILRDNERKARLELKGTWTLPLPIVQTGNVWKFDTRAGLKEMHTRRIGRNELAAIQSLHAYVDAQREYATKDRDGDGVPNYAQKILSSPGKRDGLSWPTTAGEPESPLGPLFEGKDLKDGYHGYRFHVLKAQGPAAKGGARNYVKAGRMTEGFGLVGWPVRYGETGVMTFIVNQDGVVYQKHLGPRSGAIASAMARFDPDASWKSVAQP
jgi:hypothetical protein